MSKHDELIELISQIHAAQTSAMTVLVKTLEEAGAIQAGHYEANLRMLAETLQQKSGPMVTQLILDLIDQISRDEPRGSA